MTRPTGSNGREEELSRRDLSVKELSQLFDLALREGTPAALAYVGTKTALFFGNQNRIELLTEYALEDVKNTLDVLISKGVFSTRDEIEFLFDRQDLTALYILHTALSRADSMIKLTSEDVDRLIVNADPEEVKNRKYATGMLAEVSAETDSPEYKLHRERVISAAISKCSRISQNDMDRWESIGTEMAQVAVSQGLDRLAVDRVGTR